MTSGRQQHGPRSFLFALKLGIVTVFLKQLTVAQSRGGGKKTGSPRQLSSMPGGWRGAPLVPTSSGCAGFLLLAGSLVQVPQPLRSPAAAAAPNPSPRLCSALDSASSFSGGTVAGRCSGQWRLPLRSWGPEGPRQVQGGGERLWLL